MNRPSQCPALAIGRRSLAFAALLASLFLAAVASSSQRTETDIATIPAGRQASVIAIVSIHGPIDGLTTRSVARRLGEAARRGAEAVVFEIDTPGGDLMATFDILELVRSRAPANTIAWIRPKAFSAGTIIALACREIVTTPTGRFGDAAPIQGMPLVGLRNMPAAERAKIEAPLLSELVHDARRQGWDEKLVQAFVAVDVQLWLIRHRDRGELLFVDAAEYERIFGAAPVPTRLERLPAPVYREEQTFSSPIFQSDVPTRPSTTPDAEAVQDARQAAIDFRQEIPSSRPQLDRGDADDWENLGQIVSSNELLVLRADEAIAYGLSSSDGIATEADLQKFMGATTIIRLDETWSEGLVRFLTLWPVRVVLIVVMLVGFFIELSAPGYGVFGLVAVSALAILLGAPLLAGLSDWWTVLVVLLGLALVVAELFFLPGFGVAGMLGGVLLFAGLVGTFVSGDPFDPAMRDQLFRGIAATMIAGLAASSIGWIFWRTLPNTPFASRIILGDEIGDTSPGTPPSGKPALIEIGALGIAATPLRTAGRVDVDGRLVDAQSEDGFIEQGTRIRVIAADRFGVRVEIDRS